MKHACTLCLFLLLIGALCAEERPAAQITFRVTDDFSDPVVGVTIGMSTFHHWQPGEGFGKDISETFTGVTDDKGMVTLLGSSLDGNFSYSPREKAGYYRGGGGSFQFKEKQDGRWEPWNPAVEVVVKRVVNPIPMYAWGIETRIPLPNRAYGYDVLLADWVNPLGKGKQADINFELQGHWTSYHDHDSTLVLSFPNSHDGIQEFKAPPPYQGSAFRSPRTVPDNGYRSSLALRRVRKPQDLAPAWVDDAARDANYFFRIRTRVDNQGNVVSAYYGKIYGGFKFAGASARGSFLKVPAVYLNPTLLDRNMEFDPKRNLFGDLPSSQRVITP
jgi:hypothetical protein